MVSPQPTRVLDEEALGDLRDDLGDAFEPFVRRFLESARDGLAQMQHATRAADRVRVAERAHALKGAAAYLGAVQLAAALGAVQRAAEDRACEGAPAALAQVAASLDRVAPLLEGHCGA